MNCIYIKTRRQYKLLTCRGPDAHPSLQLHSKPPITFVQVPFPQTFGILTHSLSSTHFFPVLSRTKPDGQTQRNEPSVLMHSPPSHTLGINSHSFKSLPLSILPGPSGHIFRKSAKRNIIPILFFNKNFVC